MAVKDPRIPLTGRQSLCLDLFTFVDEVRKWADAVQAADRESAKATLSTLADEVGLLWKEAGFQDAYQQATTPNLPEDTVSIVRFLSAVTDVAERFPLPDP